MDWSSKWDWENLVMFNSKMVESPKKQPTDWGIEEEGEIDAASFNLSGGGGGGSGSEVAHGSSARSSISASADSSPNEVMRTSKFAFEAFHAFPGHVSKNELPRTELAGNSPPLESSVGSGEPLIGLKLGKRTYFENNCPGGNAKTSSLSVIPVSSAPSTAKKTKSPCQNMPPARCQVEGCNLDLSSAKEYHRKHRVCESHSKCPKVIVGGLERRFCQQCSRFHSLSEFDEKKRSCRRRLSDHNARRRKPQRDTIPFNSTRLSLPFLSGRQQMNFVLNSRPLIHARSSNPTWESTCSSKFTPTKGCILNFEKPGSMDGQLQLPGSELPHAISMPRQNSNRLFPSKGSKSDIFNQGLKEPILSSNLDAAPDLHRALSLLSTDSWGHEPANLALEHPISTSLSAMPHPMMHGSSQGLPLASSDYWQPEHPIDPRRVHTMAATESGHFQEIQLFKGSYENGLFSNLLN
ncbi:hypothetical protein NMG60_11030921 [Bertholletia excelsa]